MFGGQSCWRLSVALASHFLIWARLRECTQTNPQLDIQNKRIAYSFRAIEVTNNKTGDAPILPELMNQIPEVEQIAAIYGDGAYDTKECHNAIAARGAAAIIPTRKSAQFRKENTAGARARNAILRATKYALEKWSSYHRRCLVETKMRCFKLQGEWVMTRNFDRQVAELQVRAAILNRFTQLGTPTTVGAG